MKMQNLKKGIDYRLLPGLAIGMVLILGVFASDTLGIGPSCPGACGLVWDGSSWVCRYCDAFCEYTCINYECVRCGDNNKTCCPEDGRCCDPDKTCCRNSPTGCIDPATTGCCNGEPYNLATECCMDNIVKPKCGEICCPGHEGCCYGECCDGECCTELHNPPCCPHGTFCCGLSDCVDPVKCESCVDGHKVVCDGDTSKVCCNGSCCQTKDCPVCSYGELPITLNVFPVVSTPSSQCGGCGETGGECGGVGPPTGMEVEIPTPCFTNCKWKFGASAVVNYCYGACFSMCTNVDGFGSPGVTSGNCADIADGFVYGNGCVLSGGTRFSNYFCLEIHENYHLGEYIGYVEAGATNLRNNSAFSDMNCPGEADSCVAAKSAREGAIRAAVRSVYESAEGECDEEAAVAAAQWCFYSIALGICEGGCDCEW
jgi:hypothetical protein